MYFQRELDDEIQFVEYQNLELNTEFDQNTEFGIPTIGGFGFR